VPVPRDDKNTEIGAPLERGRGLFEYSSLSQRDSVKDGFLDSILSKKLRILVACAIGIVLLLLENAYIFGIKIDQMLNLYGIGGSMVILDLPFVVALALLTLPEICYSVRQIFSKKAVPELLLPISLIAIVGYYCAVLVNAPQSYPLFGLIYSILSIAALSASLFRKNADFMAFKAIANGMEKLIIDRKATRSLDSINRALDGKVESYKSETVHVYKTKFISDFKRRCKRISENSLNNLLLIAISLGVAIVGGIVALFIPGGIVSALHILCLIFFTSCPILLIFSHKIPYYFASRAASQEQSAVIGEGSLYEYSNVDVITFKDTEVFSDEDVNIQRIMLYGKSENLTKALQHMSSIFNAVGGPLQPIFSDSLDGRVSPATNVFVEDDGISGIYHGAHIRAGSLEYMLRNGVRVPEDTTESAGRQSIKVMYAAENGEVYAKFFIRYTLSEDFTMILPSMQDDGLVPLVYTRDPNINNELFRQLSAGKDSIRVLKQTSVPEEEIVHEKLSSGMVTMGDKVNVVNLIILSKKYVAFHSKLAVYELIATIVGVTLSLALAISGLAIVPTVVLGLWQVAWCFALYFISRHHFCGVNHKNSKVKDK
jgi:hypothetical protein